MQSDCDLNVDLHGECYDLKVDLISTVRLSCMHAFLFCFCFCFFRDSDTILVKEHAHGAYRRSKHTSPYFQIILFHEKVMSAACGV